MNNVEAIRKLNERELELGIAGGPGSWHEKYSHSAVVYVGGLLLELTEGDILAVFEQFGRIVHVNLVRDSTTGKSRGFAFVEYADQRSSILAVDNFNGVDLYGNTLRVDHVDRYKRPDPDTVPTLDLNTEEPLVPHEARAESRTTPGGAAPETGAGQTESAALDDDEFRKRAVMERLAALRRRRAAEEQASSSDIKRRTPQPSERNPRRLSESQGSSWRLLAPDDDKGIDRGTKMARSSSTEYRRHEERTLDRDARKRQKLERKEERRLKRVEREERRKARAGHMPGSIG